MVGKNSEESSVLCNCLQKRKQDLRCYIRIFCIGVRVVFGTDF